MKLLGMTIQLNLDSESLQLNGTLNSRLRCALPQSSINETDMRLSSTLSNYVPSDFRISPYDGWMWPYKDCSCSRFFKLRNPPTTCRYSHMYPSFNTSAGRFASQSQSQPRYPESLQMTKPNASLSNVQDDSLQRCPLCYSGGHFPVLDFQSLPVTEWSGYGYVNQQNNGQEYVADTLLPVRNSAVYLPFTDIKSGPLGFGF